MHVEFKSEDQVAAHPREHLTAGITLPHAGPGFKNAITATSNEVLKNVR